MWNILTKDGIYCCYLKWIYSSKEKYYDNIKRKKSNTYIYHPDKKQMTEAYTDLDGEYKP